jgi:hypothetical protein
MTKVEATNLKSFKNHCQCGGFARTMNGRPECQPHMRWCPQYAEYAEWCEAMKKDSK